MHARARARARHGRSGGHRNRARIATFPPPPPPPPCVCVRARSADAMAANATKRSSITFERAVLRDKPVPYTVTDKPPPRNSPDWARVVGVIVQVRAAGVRARGWVGRPPPTRPSSSRTLAAGRGAGPRAAVGPHSPLRQSPLAR